MNRSQRHSAFHATRLGLTLSALLLAAVSAVAQDSSPAYNFLNITSSSHVYGLGGINISTVEDDINIVDQNPGLLGPEIDMQAGINYMRYIGQSNFAGVKYGMAINDRSAWAAGVQYLDYGSIEGYDENGIASGTFAPKDLCINAMYAHDITDRLRGGINLKFVSSTYESYSAMAIATDLGLNYYDPESDLSLSFVVANLGGQVKRFNETYDRLPVDVRLGFTKSFGHLPVRFSVTAWNLTKWSLPYYEPADETTGNEGGMKETFASNLFRHLVFAADFVPSSNFHIGIGYNYRTRTDMRTTQRNFLSGWSIGAGLKLKAFGVGVAYAQPHTGASTIMLNISTNLYELRNR